MRLRLASPVSEKLRTEPQGEATASVRVSFASTCVNGRPTRRAEGRSLERYELLCSEDL